MSGRPPRRDGDRRPGPARGRPGKGGRDARRPDRDTPIGVGHGRDPIDDALAALLPPARAGAATPTPPADAALRAFFKSRPELGRRDRARVAETVFDVLRNLRLYRHFAESGMGPPVRRLRWLSRTLRFEDPAPPNDPDLARWLQACRETDPATLPPAVRFSLPDWLWEALSTRLDAPEALAAAMLEPAPLDLRVNPAKGDAGALAEALRARDVRIEPLPWPPGALRVQGKPVLDATPEFEAGRFEVQDAGSQLLAWLCAPRRGQAVVDFCAGAGGKTLALAALMRETGQVYAMDVSTARLARLKPRLARSGATNVQPFALDSEHDERLARLAGRADRVLVDAPCSGTGTLRRNPDLKWKQGPDAVDELNAKQSSILAAAAKLVKPGGRLVYATCSLLDDENGRIADAFLAAHPGFRPLAVDAVLAAQRIEVPADATEGGRLRLRPDRHGTDGFFAAVFERTAG